MSVIAAIENQHLDIVAFFLDQGFPIDAAASSAAARVGSVELYQTFVDHGWDINELPENGCASLKWVSKLPPPFSISSVHHGVL